MFRKRLTIRRVFFTSVAAVVAFFIIQLSSAPATSAFEYINISETVNTKNWKTYQDDTYKFEIKYPEQWADPLTEEMHEPGLEGVFKVSFSSEKLISDKVAGGFSVYIFKSDACTLEDKAAENAVCPSVELRKLEGAQSAYLYEASGEVYTYTLIPTTPEDKFSLLSREDIVAQFEAALKSFNFDPAAGVISVVAPPAPKPAVKNNPSRISGFVGKPSKILAKTRTVNGRKVCAKKNDKPTPSKNNPKWQVDGECCLDPYEIPNSRCYYPPEKYGSLIQKYLASQNK